jgi:hypothetical protein
VTYEDYLAMTPDEQQAFYDSFASEDEFFAWFVEAKAAYDAAKDEEHVDVGEDGSIDIGDLVGGGDGEGGDGNG